MGRPRKHGKGLPRHVVLSRGWYFHKAPRSGSWTRLARADDLPGMFAALSQHLAGENAGTMNQIIDAFEHDELPKKAPKTQKEYRSQLPRLRAAFGAMAINSVTSRDVARYLINRQAKVSGDREIALFSSVCSYGVSPLLLIDSNPCTGVRRNKTKHRRILPDPQSIMLAWTLAPRHVRAYMALAYCTGQRMADVLSMRETDLSRQGLGIVQAKTGTRLELVWTRNLSAAVQFALKMRPVTPITRHLICTARGQAYSVGALQSAWKKIQPRIAEDGGVSFPLSKLRARSAEDHATGAHLGHLDPRVLGRHYRSPRTKATPI